LAITAPASRPPAARGRGELAGLGGRPAGGLPAPPGGLQGVPEVSTARRRSAKRRAVGSSSTLTPACGRAAQVEQPLLSLFSRSGSKSKARRRRRRRFFRPPRLDQHAVQGRGRPWPALHRGPSSAAPEQRRCGPGRARGRRRAPWRRALLPRRRRCHGAFRRRPGWRASGKLSPPRGSKAGSARRRVSPRSRRRRGATSARRARPPRGLAPRATPGPGLQVSPGPEGVDMGGGCGVEQAHGLVLAVHSSRGSPTSLRTPTPVA
jgi:hypothetical protein